MLGQIASLILIDPVVNMLIALYRTFGNLGVAIVLLTIVIRTALIPAVMPSIKMSKKQRDLQPELDDIKKKFKYDKKKQAELQMELFKKHGVNPASGCLTTILTIIVMIGFYQAVIMFTTGKDVSLINNRIYFESLKFAANESINTSFLYLDLTKPDPFYIIAFVSSLLQLLATKMMMPYSKIEEKAAKVTPEKSDDFLATMQKQNLFMMPIIIFWFTLKLPAGVGVYIITSTLFQIAQTYFTTGWGGLKPWLSKLKFVKKVA